MRRCMVSTIAEGKKLWGKRVAKIGNRRSNVQIIAKILRLGESGGATMRQIAAATFLLTLAVALFGAFIAMGLNGIMYIGEPNSAVRILETVLLGLLAIFAFWNFYRTMYRTRREER